MDNDSAEHPIYVTACLARQPIFTSKNKVWGYEILYRENPDADKAVFTDEDLATLTVASNLFSMSLDSSEKAKVVINFPQRSIMEQVPQSLPPETTVLEIPELPTHNPRFVPTLKSLRQMGYSVSLDGYVARQDCQELAEIADVIKIDVLDLPGYEIEVLLSKAREHGALVAAKRVEDIAAHSKVRELGFDLFQGFFFKRPEIIEGKRLTSSDVSRLNLFRILEKKNPDFETLSDAVETDVSISYRLLRYLNSPSFTLSREITSIQQAVLLLGWKTVKNWLRVIILTDFNPPGSTSELPFLSVQRARFLELAAGAMPGSNLNPDSLFLLGLFSLLEPMLRIPRQEIFKELPLEGELKKALLQDSGRYSGWLPLVAAFEKADWLKADTLLQFLGLESVLAAQAYYQSMVWANDFFGHLIT